MSLRSEPTKIAQLFRRNPAFKGKKSQSTNEKLELPELKSESTKRKTVSFSPPIKIFLSLQLRNAELGLIAPQPLQKHPFNLRNIVVLLIFTSFFISIGAYHRFEAEAFSEYAECIYMEISFLCGICMFASLLSKSANFFELIQKIESSIQKREH